MEFGRRLYELRTKHNMTIKELSKASGVSESQIRNLERGRRKPSLATMELLAKGLKVTNIDLLNDGSDTERLTIEEKNVLKWYRNLPKDKAACFLCFVSANQTMTCTETN